MESAMGIHAPEGGSALLSKIIEEAQRLEAPSKPTAPS
jgi:hypothetical protein